MLSRAEAIRERIYPKVWDAAYIHTSSNIEVFNKVLKMVSDKGLNPLRILDLGCGYKPFEKIFEKLGFNYQYIGVDFSKERSDADLILDLNKDKVPFEDNYFDVVIISEVLEHLYNPINALKESSRLLKKGGYLYISTPFVFYYHDEPHDYYRYTEFFYKRIAEELNLEILYIKKSGTFFSVPIFTFNMLISAVIEKVKLKFLRYLIFPVTNTIAITLDKIVLYVGNYLNMDGLQGFNCGIALILSKPNV